MDKSQQRDTLSQNSAYLSAANEGEITANDLITEVKPLLEEYFVGKFESGKRSITMSFPNGQTFTLSIN